MALHSLNKQWKHFRWIVYGLFIILLYQSAVFSLQPKKTYPPHRYAAFADYDVQFLYLYLNKELPSKPKKEDLEKIGIRLDYQKAREEAEKALRVCPNEVRIHQYLAQSLYHLGHVKEAALIATRDKRQEISSKDISEALDRVELGFKRRRKMTEEERRRIAYHEAGHVVVTYLLHPTDDVFKASIISRRDALGVVYHQPREELFTSSRTRYLANIKAALGGFVSEKLKFESKVAPASSSAVIADNRSASTPTGKPLQKTSTGA